MPDAIPANSANMLPRSAKAQYHHREERDPQAEFFADEIRQPFASRCRHSGRHFLHSNKGDGRRNEGPKQGVSVFRSCLRIGEDATRIVVYIRGDEAWADNGQECQKTVLEHAHLWCLAGAVR
jgi:hypothetical protein